MYEILILGLYPLLLELKKMLFKQSDLRYILRSLFESEDHVNKIITKDYAETGRITCFGINFGSL